MDDPLFTSTKAANNVFPCSLHIRKKRRHDKILKSICDGKICSPFMIYVFCFKYYDL